ncbi:MAG: hypothetical protein KDD60_05440 [Bdellovibrionales bacterium]|nr:hypothetical protein [Bdellovibrionales bacterium]
MSNYSTNGFLVALLEAANADTKHPDHGEASIYLSKFRALETKFFQDVHPFVDFGLAISESKKSGCGRTNIFTVHGCQHVYDLIRSLDKFAKSVSQQASQGITVLEAYILLCAAHVHDSANVSKREDHPERCREVLAEHKDLFVSSVSQQIYDVASVHGGHHPEYGKDTFRTIDVDAHTPPRLLLIASILRLADELSENEDRVPESVVEHHEPSAMSKLAHAYARSFKNFELRNESLSITYGVYPEDHNLTVEREGKRQSFYDFLEEKIDVIEKEARYCSQYGRPSLHISEINIVVRQYDGMKPSKALKTEKFSLYLNHGYPKCECSLCERADGLANRGVMKLSGFFVESKLEGVSRTLNVPPICAAFERFKQRFFSK